MIYLLVEWLISHENTLNLKPNCILIELLSFSILLENKLGS